MSDAPTLFLAEQRGEQLVDLLREERLPLRRGAAGSGAASLPDGELAGALLVGRRTADGATVEQLLAPAGTARHALLSRLVEEQLDPYFAPELEAVAAARAAQPLAPEAELVDMESVPFVTVDGAHTRDLDQALWVESRADGGFRALYAIADAATAVPRGGPLFAEALRRGASLYLPGFSVPMLPRSLSEGAVSLNAGVARRALVFELCVDATGERVSASLARARVRSRHKLSFEDVQSVYAGQEHTLGAEVSSSLHALREFGRARVRRAESLSVVRYRREEISLAGPADGTPQAELSAVREAREEVESYNEQLSLLCNHEGGRFLLEAGWPEVVQAIYRVHPAPPRERLEQLARMTRTLTRAHQLPAHCEWVIGSRSLSAYLEQLPTEGPAGRVARAIARQALLTNLRSSFTATPGLHSGVGADPYARFSAPMRELVGVFVQGEAYQLLDARSGGLPAASRAADETLRDAVVSSAENARQRQKRFDDYAHRLVLDRLFAADVARPREERRRYDGVVLGLSSGKVHVGLNEPPLDVKVYFYDLARALGGVWLEIGEDDTALLRSKERTPVLRVGDAIGVRVLDRDRERDRWVLEPLLG